MLSRALNPLKLGVKGPIQSLTCSLSRRTRSVAVQSGRHLLISSRFNSGISDSNEIGSPSPPVSNDTLASSASEVSVSTSGVEIMANGIVTNADPELGYYPVDFAMYAIEQLHLLGDIPYWQAIIGFTVGIRILLLPIALKGVQNANRMALLKPDMEKVQNAMKANDGASDPKMQARYQLEMKELFKKHNVNPFRAIALPFLQMPIFISLFMALRQMQDYFPGYCEGGTLWFTDLSVADPTYVLPVLNAFSFLLMVEIGADGMDQANRGMFKNVMRGLAVVMIPLTSSMPQVYF